MSKPHITCGRGEDGAYTIHIDGKLRGKYNSPEMMQVHLADMIAECDELRRDRDEWREALLDGFVDD